MTLIELLVSIGVIAAIITVLATTLVVTLRQEDSTQARVDVARWEQALALWMPADLSSASTVDDSPSAAPAGCPGSVCSNSSNVLQLEWGVAPDMTTVSYRYGPSDSGDGFVMTRVECGGGGCDSMVVLRDLAPPTPPWTPGDPIDDAVIDVTAPIAADSTDTDDTDTSTAAQRVIVTVNGVPSPDGVDRSSRVSFTAGGATRSTIDAPTFDGPTFLDAQSSCGGPITLIVDESLSIGSADDDVEAAVEDFIDTFAGTPTLLQVIEFSSGTRAVGATGGAWNKYWDLTEAGDVSGLKAALDVNSNGFTNWEDALFRTFFYRDGTTYAAHGDPNAPTPELVVFFTDGQPTRDRKNERADTAATSPPNATSPWSSTGFPFSPRGWFRADYVADQFRSIRMIGVGVGSSFGGTTTYGSTFDHVPNEVFLGDLVTGGDPSQYGTGASGNYVKREYSGGWGDVSNADLLVSSDLGNLASALSEIALSECGGTLTVQTRTTSGDLAPIDATYRIGAEQSTTSPVRKAAVFDVAVSGAATTVQLIPQIDTPGWVATDWSCTSKGVDLGSGYSDIGADPIDGLNVTVDANGAVACTMTVASS